MKVRTHTVDGMVRGHRTRNHFVCRICKSLSKLICYFNPHSESRIQNSEWHSSYATILSGCPDCFDLMSVGDICPPLPLSLFLRFISHLQRLGEFSLIFVKYHIIICSQLKAKNHKIYGCAGSCRIFSISLPPSPHKRRRAGWWHNPVQRLFSSAESLNYCTYTFADFRTTARTRSQTSELLHVLAPDILLRRLDRIRTGKARSTDWQSLRHFRQPFLS